MKQNLWIEKAPSLVGWQIPAIAEHPTPLALAIRNGPRLYFGGLTSGAAFQLTNLIAQKGWARFYGYISTTGSPGNLTLSILFPAAAASFIATPPASLSLGMFMCEAHFRCAVAGPSGSANVRIWAMFANSSTGVPVFYQASDDIDLDTTPSIAFDVTGQFANSGQTLRIEQGTLEVVR